MRKLKTNELNRVDLDTFKNQKKNNLVILLDNVRSMNNVGSAFRTSDAFSIQQLALCGITATPPHREIQKTALGAQDAVDWKHFKTTNDAIQHYKQEGYIILGIEQTDEKVFLQEYAFKSDEKYVMVFGNEAFGISDDVLPLLDTCIEIPQYGTKHSLNVSVTIGVCVWDYLSKIG